MAFVGMSEKEIATYRQYFWSQDKSGDGRLDREEFKNMMKSMGVSLNDRDIIKAFNAADVDKSGTISFNEFAQTYLNKQVPKTNYNEEYLRQVFKSVDKDRDGSLTTQECLGAMKKFHKNLTEEGMRKVMQLMDKNKDGGITYNEFRHFMEI